MRALALLVVTGVLAWTVASAGGCNDKPPPKGAHGALAGFHEYDPSADGKKQIAAAVAQANTEHKRVLVVFGGNWCKWCKALDGLFQKDARIKAVLDKSFVVAHVDSDTNGALNTEYKNPFVNGFPVILVLDGAGTLLHTQESGVLEKEDKSVGHDPDKVMAFLTAWVPT
ncbi:MAG TPA: thioredoxin family protein [Myxococcota bacterium]|jgi:thiol-disulfide isomerase/thioredoxin